jgi:hypothetical protein
LQKLCRGRAFALKRKFFKNMIKIVTIKGFFAIIRMKRFKAFGGDWHG